MVRETNISIEIEDLDDPNIAAEENRSQRISLAAYRNRSFESKSRITSVNSFSSFSGIGNHWQRNNDTPCSSPKKSNVDEASNRSLTTVSNGINDDKDLSNDADDGKYLSNDANDDEESCDDCPIDAEQRIAETQDCVSPLVQIKRLNDMITCLCGLVFMMYILIQYSDPWDFALISVHSFIRSLIDFKYDLSSFNGWEKIKMFFQLLFINLVQLRLLYDLYLAYSHETIFSFTLIMTQVTDALFKRVPQGSICVRRLFLALHEGKDVSKLAESIEIFVPLFLLLVCTFFGTSVMSRFEIAMNSRAAKIKYKISVYFLFDFTLRVISFGSIWHLYTQTDQTPLLVSTIAFIYLVNTSLFLCHFISRGYVYAPKEEEINKPTSLIFQTIFSFFPAGFIQSFTDFPFNAEFSSKRWLFILHQIISTSEFIAIFVMSHALTDIEKHISNWVLIVFRALIPILVFGKTIFFVYYLNVKVPIKPIISQSEKMTKMSTERSVTSRPTST